MNRLQPTVRPCGLALLHPSELPSMNAISRSRLFHPLAGAALLLLAPFSGPSVPLIIFNALTGAVFIVMSIGCLMGWPLRLVIHSSLVFTALNLIYECVTTGGLFSTAIC